MELKKLRFKKMDKRGIFGLDAAASFVVSILSLVIIAVLALVILGTLLATSTISNTVGAGLIVNNTTQGIASLFSSAVTWFVLLGIVILVLIIAVVVRVVRSDAFSGGRTTGL